MFENIIYQQRRSRLKEKLSGGKILLLGNNDSPMNYKHNAYPFRQDSSFLYFVGVDQPNFACILDLDSGNDVLFGYEYSVDDIVWMGEQPKLTEWANKSGFDQYKNISDLADYLNAHMGDLHYLPLYRHDNIIFLADALGKHTSEIKTAHSEQLVKSVISLRSIKEDREIIQMEEALETTFGMHVGAMQAVGPGVKESRLAGMVEGIAIGNLGRLSYPAILSKNGQTLHNHDHSNVLQKGDLVLGDYGAENWRHYAGDITRTFPVDTVFTEQQKDIYQLVLVSQLKAISMLKPGISFKSIHLETAKILTEGLISLGLMKGNIDDAVKNGAHALFFPHGLGHMIGLDVHDMEDLGEDLVGYDDKTKRSKQFGLAFLRLGKELEAGHVLTVEPGLYFIPALIDQWKNEKKHSDFINYDVLDQWKNFGGVRIEDNILITNDGHKILGRPIPKTISEIEGLRGYK